MRAAERVGALLIFLGVAALAALPAIVSAAPKLMVYDVEVRPDPQIQGPDLPIVVRARVGCGGACCYVVYGRELRAEILLPSNFTLVDGASSQWLTSPGHTQGTVAAQPGGGLTWLSAVWEVRCPDLGVFNISVRVTGTNDAGDSINVTSSAEVTIASGAAISSPIFPHRPVVGRETSVLASVASRKGVASVVLHYREGGVWRSAPMTKVEGDLYRASIPASARETTYEFYMESVDTANDTFRTGVYEIRVTDPGRVAEIAGAATIAVAAGSLGGMLLILYLGSRRALPLRPKGIFPVGSPGMEPALRDREGMRAAQRRLCSLRWRLLAVLVALTIALFLIALLTGQLERVVGHTTSPQEALVRWW